MRIAYLVNQYPKVSHSFIRREIRALERQGVEVLRFALRGWNGELADGEDRLERERTRYVLRGGMRALAAALALALAASPRRFARALALAMRIGWRADRPLALHLAYLAEACVLVSWLREAGAEHLHAHFGTNSAAVAMLARELGGPRYSFTVHGPEEFDKPRAIALGEKLRRAAFAVAVSSYGRGQLLRWLGHSHWSKVAVVRCGLDEEFHGATPVPVPRAPRLVCVGRLCEQKGQALLIEAAARLAAEGVAFELVLAGDGEMRLVLEDLIAAKDLRGRVRITGWISSARVREEILAARALVLPSFAEGLPVVLMEAMALRRPVTTTSVAGIPELVRDGENGWLIPAGDVDALALALKEALASPVEKLEAMGSAGRAIVLARHSADREAAKLAALFRRALGTVA